MNTKTITGIVVSAAIIGASPAQAILSAHEGLIKSITDNRNGTLTMVCGETAVIINSSTILQSPATFLTFAQLLDATPFTAAGFNPITGAKRAGFVGGHCLATGDTVTAPQFIANKVMVDLGEASATGLVTSKAPFAIDGASIVPVPEARLGAMKPAPGFYNSAGVHPAGASTTWPNAWTESVMSNEGFGINTSSVLAGSIASAIGFNGSDGALHAYDIVADGQLLRSDARASISRAQCTLNGKGKDQLDVRGGCVLGKLTSTPIKVEYLTAGQTLSAASIWSPAGVNATCAAVAPLVATPGTNVGRYRFQNQAMNLNGQCPSRVRVTADNIKYDISVSIR